MNVHCISSSCEEKTVLPEQRRSKALELSKKGANSMFTTTNSTLGCYIARAAIGLLALAGLLVAPRAKACGGFFCSQATPVNQAAEQIIFSKNGDGTVTAVVNIQYQGAAERFAWVLPVNGVPDVALSSSLAFSRLLNATSPSYNLTVQVEGQCGPPPGSVAAGGAPSMAFPVASGGSGGASGSGVVVQSSGSVGPYDFVTIAVEGDSSEPAQVALDGVPSRAVGVPAAGAEHSAALSVAGQSAPASGGCTAGVLDPGLPDLLESVLIDAVGVHGQPGRAVVDPEEVLIADVAGVASERVGAHSADGPVVGDVGQA